jgi:hypothetical protein
MGLVNRSVVQMVEWGRVRTTSQNLLDYELLKNEVLQAAPLAFGECVYLGEI